MRSIFFIPVFLFTVLLSLEPTRKLPSAEELLTNGIRKAKKERKNVFVFFHSSWCGPCRLMQKTIDDPAIKPYFSSNYAIVDMTVYEFDEARNNPGASNLLEKHNNGQSSVPFWMILDTTGKSLGDAKMKPTRRPGSIPENIGCPATNEEITYFVSLLRKTSSMNEETLKAIEKRFKKNN